LNDFQAQLPASRNRESIALEQRIPQHRAGKRHRKGTGELPGDRRIGVGVLAEVSGKHNGLGLQAITAS
jgi:hypothetical protein